MKNVNIKDKNQMKQKKSNNAIEDTMIHDYEVTLLGSKKDKNDDREKIFTYYIELVKTVK